MANGQQGKSSVWKWVGIGCGVLVLIGACIAVSCIVCSGGIVGTALQATEAPAEASHAFFRDTRAGNWQGAHARMNATYQSTHTPESMQMAAASIPAITQNTDSTFSGRSVMNNVATMTGVLTTPSGSVPVEVVLSGSGTTWYIDSVTVQGMMLQ